MRRPLIATAASLVLVAAAVYAAVAQSDLTGAFAPFVVDVQQAVPVEVAVAVPINGGETVTATVPMTVNVALRVSVEGPSVVSVKPLSKTKPDIEVTQPTPEPAQDPVLAWSGSEVQSLEGLEVAVNGIAIIDAATARESSKEMAELLDRSSFEGATTVGVINVAITNTTDSKLAAFLTRGEVIIGSTQISLGDFESYALGDITGEIYPGVVKHGTIVFASSELDLSELGDGVDVYFNGDKPHDGDYYTIGDEEYEFKVHLMPRSE